MKTYAVGTHLKRLTEALQMSTHNICFRVEIRKTMWTSPHTWSYISTQNVKNFYISTFCVVIVHFKATKLTLRRFLFMAGTLLPAGRLILVIDFINKHFARWVKFSADDILKYFLIFPSKIGFDLSCNCLLKRQWHEVSHLIF